ncbi:hypothetical protein EGW08_013936, partial [Elysia chlorotica]
VGINTVVAVAVLSNNIVLLITLARTRKLWNSTNAYIASLAAADLLLGIMLIVRNFWIIPETSWVFHNNEYVCMPIVCLLYVSCLESITCLAMVSLDRYAYIVWPFWYERHVNKRLITISIALSWVVCIAFGFLPMRLNKFTTDSGCDPLSIISREYLLFGMNFYLFAAEVLIAAMYGRIYCVGNHQRKKIEASTGGFARQRLNSKADSIAARWQVIRFLILVCGTFFLCWMPLQIISILYFTVGTPVIAISVGISFAAINSALNIYILIAMNKTFKAALFGMIC